MIFLGLRFFHGDTTLTASMQIIKLMAWAPFSIPFVFDQQLITQSIDRRGSSRTQTGGIVHAMELSECRLDCDQILNLWDPPRMCSFATETQVVKAFKVVPVIRVSHDYRDQDLDPVASGRWISISLVYQLFIKTWFWLPIRSPSSRGVNDCCAIANRRPNICKTKEHNSWRC